jgi:DUF438 domain-containing protein
MSMGGRVNQRIHCTREITADTALRLGNYFGIEPEFWIELGGKFILIQYFAVFGKEGEYTGCLEVIPDITRIRQLEGEQRIVDW